MTVKYKKGKVTEACAIKFSLMPVLDSGSPQWLAIFSRNVNKRIKRKPEQGQRGVMDAYDCKSEMPLQVE